MHMPNKNQIQTKITHGTHGLGYVSWAKLFPLIHVRA